MATNKDIKIIVSGNEARRKLKAGINKACEIAALTLGPSGSNIVIERLNDFPMTTNDGVRIVNRISLEDEVENMGANLVAKMAENTDTVGGDGTTTACVLLGAIINKVMPDSPTGSLDKYMKSSFNPMENKKRINESLTNIKEKLLAMARPIESDEDINMVALVSSESKEIADIVTGLFSKLGKNGQVVVDDSNGFNIESEIIDGYQVESGLPAIHYANTKRNFCELTSPLILLTNEKLESLGQLDKLINEYSDARKMVSTPTGGKIVIFCEDYTTEMLGMLITLKVRLGLVIVPIKVPAFKKGDTFEDLESVTGATLIDVSKGESVSNVGYDADVWGGCEEVVIRIKDTIIKRGSRDTSDIITKINDEIKNNTQLTQHQIKKLNERISKLSQGIGVIRVGAPTRTEQEYLRFKVDDTVNATRAALQGGVVRGGGLALLELEYNLDENDILRGVLSAPHKQILSNAGVTNMEIPDNIVDPVNVTINSLEKACSVAGMVITTGAVIATKRVTPRPEDDNIDE